MSRYRRLIILSGVAAFAWSACASTPDPKNDAPAEAAHAAKHASAAHEATPIQREDEPHLVNVRQLTFGGQNAEAYFSKDGSELVFQSTRGDYPCDRIFRMRSDGTSLSQVSVGQGRTTCGYIQIDGSIVYASTHAHGEGCLAEPDRSQGYVWPLYSEMDIWRADANGQNAKLLFQSKGYDAEATICHEDGRIVFTSTMNGDLDLYVMDRDGKNVRQLTDTPGYDGGAFFSPDCTKIVWRASRPAGEALDAYRALLAKNLVRPSKLEIYVMDADGSNVVQVTENGAANFAPYMHGDNEHILFASNKDDPRGRNFDIFLTNVARTKMERITNNPTFDGFPMWSHDGKQLVFASNRHNEKPGETNVFIADWKW